MAFGLPFTVIFTTLLLLLAISTILMRRPRISQFKHSTDKVQPPRLSDSFLEPTKFIDQLVSELPDCIILPHNVSDFKHSMNSYWAQQECEVNPACVVRPRNIQQLSTLITLLKHEYDKNHARDMKGMDGGMFAIRSGGHSPVAGAASVKGGVLIDLSLFCEVEASADRTAVNIGAGARWMDVSKALDDMGLAVTGGRNSAVGVGGLTLGGGLSFFSPRFGLVCSNIISYEIVLASGSVATASASASTNADLWYALKGGANNFGIVTRFTARSFPSTKIWSGFLYLPSFQATKVLAAFHEWLNRADGEGSGISYDDYAAGPIACFSYIQVLGVQAIAVNLVHTKPPDSGKSWPAIWKTSSLSSLWRLWSTCKIRTLTSATDEMDALNPPGRRQVFATTTIKNDPETLNATHAAYCDAIIPLRRANVKGLVWTLVLQPLLSDWVSKGDANPLGLGEGIHEPLVMVSFTVNWDKRQHDDLVKSTTRRAIEQIEAAAAARNTGHRYRYLNYCADWQKPFESYGEENMRFLQGVSRKYDTEGLFQKGCAGGFKLGLADET